MQKDRILYTILSVIALIIVVIGIVFAWQAYNEENNNINENNTLNN